MTKKLIIINLSGFFQAPVAAKKLWFDQSAAAANSRVAFEKLCHDYAKYSCECLSETTTMAWLVRQMSKHTGKINEYKSVGVL